MIPNDNHLRVEVTRHFRGLFRRNSAERFVKSPSKIPSYLLDNLLTDLPKKRISSTETEFILHIFSRSGVVQGAVLLEGWAWWTMKILRFFTNFHSSNLISWPWRGRCVFIVDNVWEITGKLCGFYPHILVLPHVEKPMNSSAEDLFRMRRTRICWNFRGPIFLLNSLWYTKNELENHHLLWVNLEIQWPFSMAPCEFAGGYPNQCGLPWLDRDLQYVFCSWDLKKKKHVFRDSAWC